MFIVIIDAQSKWPEVYEMQSITTQSTIDVLRHVFATYSLPQLISDNGPQIISCEFSKFLQENGVKHIRCSPYHPTSNGLAERFVWSFKQAMKAGGNVSNCSSKTGKISAVLSHNSSCYNWMYSSITLHEERVSYQNRLNETKM